MCLYKKQLLNPKYLPTKKNGYNPPKLTDERFRYIEAECGKCWECRKKKARQWAIRIGEELRGNKGVFATLTLNEECLESLCKDLKINKEKIKGKENLVLKTALRRCLERIRKQTGKSIKHWCVSELGEERGRMHLHGIFFGDRAEELVRGQWGYGFVYIGTYCNERTANYITKYMQKTDLTHPWFTGRCFTSAGIGRGFVDRQCSNNAWRGKETIKEYICRNGTRVAMPDYYKRKIWTDEQRELLWGWAQEDDYTYVRQERLLKSDEQAYKNLTQYYRQLDKKVHKDNPLEWEQRKRENKRQRRYEAMKRINKEHKKDIEKRGFMTEEELLNVKYNVKLDDSYCRLEKYVISLAQQKETKQPTIIKLNL